LGYSEKIKEAALQLGFADCGIAPAVPLTDAAARLRRWLGSGYQAGMIYMDRHINERTNPALLVENARSVVVVLQNYYTISSQADPEAPVLSKYVYGRDHHRVVKKKLKLLMDHVHKITGSATGRAFVDSAPVLEKALGRMAGLGWIGKNSLLLSRKYGSFFFIGSLIIDKELEYDRPVREYCGSCTRCMEACPTGAITAARIVDANRCISYMTIENKEDTIPEQFREKFENRVFGCDMCQDICPWNINLTPHQEPGLEVNHTLLSLSKDQWHQLTESKFNELFKGSAVKRAGYAGLMRNLRFIRKNVKK
jgi:epoxyqueuosine reductase